MLREFRLSPSGKSGVSCDADGAFVGAIPVLDRLQKDGKDEWQPRDCNELSDEMGESYGLPIDMSSKAGGLKAIANALNDGDVARAQIATVLLGIPDLLPLSKRAHSREQMLKLIRDLHWSGMIKWDPDKHPRWPARSADSAGGEFAPEGEDGGVGASLTSQSNAASQTRPHDNEPRAAGRSARIQLADAGMSDAVDDPIAGAASRSVTGRRQNAGAAGPQAKPIDGEYESFWQSFGSNISHEVKSAFAQIGQAEVDDSYNNLAFAIDQRNAIAHALRSYAYYRAKPWFKPNGQRMQVPVGPAVDETNDPLVDASSAWSDSIAASARPMRPATNADWIDPLVNLLSAGTMGAGMLPKLVGPSAGLLDATEIAAPSVRAVEHAEGSFSITNWSEYPSDLPQPTGPFRLLNGEGYDAARAAANNANRALRDADPTAYIGKEIHEIHPIKFGGSPTDPANKIALTPPQHISATTWWARLQRGLLK